jgi:Anti-sigma-K factor rskA, C-terminal
MTDRTEDAPTPAELAAINELLASEAVWAEADPRLEDAILAQIAAESEWLPRQAQQSGAAEGESAVELDDNVVPLRRRSRQRIIVGVAAVAVFFAALGFAVGQLDSPPSDDFEIALAGTDIAPTANATAAIKATGLGLRIRLDISGLEPAPAGSYYQAWIRNKDGGAVTAGTFHMRGGDGEIELWTGVLMDEYPIITVTLQNEGDGAQSSGVVVLKGVLEQ